MAQDFSIMDTQSQTQRSLCLTLESQPLEKIVWGRLYAKNIKLKSLDLNDEEFTFGRSESSTLCITKHDFPEKIFCRISKIHFKIERDLSDLNNPVYIYDLARNGTFVNGEKIGFNKKRLLVNDDTISIVNSQYKIYVFKDLGPNQYLDVDKEITINYYVSRKLGSGACGVVHLLYDKLSCSQFAMKHVVKNSLEISKHVTRKETHKVLNEVEIMKALNHPCVIKMHNIIDKPQSVYMILDYMKGGDLLSRILKNNKLSEKISKLYFYQMCLAVKYLHDKGITHRDLKPDNVLLETDDLETLVKVSDFGLSKFVSKDSIMKTLCGTPLYVAPEILVTRGRGSYNEKVDIWSLGVVLFTCLSGSLPFSDSYGSPALEQIKRGVFSFRHTAWRNVSAMAKSVILETLTVDPNLRPNIDQILGHPWLRDREMIRKANKLMNINTEDSLAIFKKNFESIPEVKENIIKPDEEIFEPPRKRIKI